MTLTEKPFQVPVVPLHSSSTSMYQMLQSLSQLDQVCDSICAGICDQLAQHKEKLQQVQMRTSHAKSRVEMLSTVKRNSSTVVMSSGVYPSIGSMNLTCTEYQKISNDVNMESVSFYRRMNHGTPKLLQDPLKNRGEEIGQFKPEPKRGLGKPHPSMKSVDGLLMFSTNLPVYSSYPDSACDTDTNAEPVSTVNNIPNLPPSLLLNDPLEEYYESLTDYRFIADRNNDVPHLTLPETLGYEATAVDAWKEDFSLDPIFNYKLPTVSELENSQRVATTLPPDPPLPVIPSESIIQQATAERVQISSQDPTIHTPMPVILPTIVDEQQRQEEKPLVVSEPTPRSETTPFDHPIEMLDTLPNEEVSNESVSDLHNAIRNFQFSRLKPTQGNTPQPTQQPSMIHSRIEAVRHAVNGLSDSEDDDDTDSTWDSE